MALRRDQKLLITAAVLTVGLWVVPFLRPLILPLVYFNTHIHELAHALAALATGGQVEYIHVYADGSGATPVRGGAILFVASAGYVGAAVVGGLMILGSRTEDSARRTLWTAFAFMLLSILLFVRFDTVGILSGILWTGALCLAARFLKKDAVILLTQFLGLSLALTSLQSVLILLNLTTNPGLHNDAKILQDATFIPGIVWALLWTAISVIAIWTSLKSAWKPARPTPHDLR